MKKDIVLFKSSDSLYFKKIHSKEDISPQDTCDGYLIQASEKETRRIIDSLKGSHKKIAVLGNGDSFNRRAIETLKIDYLISPELGTLRDTLKQRDSGLNHVVAREAAKKKIKIVIDLSSIGKLSALEKISRLQKIMQNIVICRKTGCGIVIASFATSKKEMASEISRKSLGSSLGMSSQQTTGSTSFT